MSDSNPPIVWDSALVFQLQIILVGPAVICLGYGCVLILAIIAVRILLQRGLASIARRYLLAAVLAVAVSSTILCAVNLAYELAALAMGPYNDNQDALKLSERVFVVGTVFDRIIYVLNDVLVVWRAWVLADYRTLRVIMAVSLVITAGCLIAEEVLIIQAGLFAPDSLTSNLLLLIPLTWNNLFATSVVLYKTWIYRTQIRRDLQASGQKGQVESVLFLLVESGFIYCGWWILLIIVEYVPSVPTMMLIVITSLAPFVAAIYPLLIILIVEHQKSRAGRGRPEESFNQSLQFESPARESSTQTHAISIVQSIVDIQFGRKDRGIYVASEKPSNHSLESSRENRLSC